MSVASPTVYMMRDRIRVYTPRITIREDLLPVDPELAEFDSTSEDIPAFFRDKATVTERVSAILDVFPEATDVMLVGPDAGVHENCFVRRTVSRVVDGRSVLCETALVAEATGGDTTFVVREAAGSGLRVGDAPQIGAGDDAHIARSVAVRAQEFDVAETEAPPTGAVWTAGAPVALWQWYEVLHVREMPGHLVCQVRYRKRGVV